MRIARVLGLERFLTLFETPRPDSGWSHRASHDLGWTLSRQEAAILRELDRRPATADSFQEDDRRRSHHLAGVDEVLHVVLDTVAAIAPALREFVALLGTLETPRWSFGEGREGFAVGRNAWSWPRRSCDATLTCRTICSRPWRRTACESTGLNSTPS